MCEIPLELEVQMSVGCPVGAGEKPGCPGRAVSALKQPNHLSSSFSPSFGVCFFFSLVLTGCPVAQGGLKPTFG